MAKSKKKRKTERVPNLSEDRYQRLLLILIQAWETSDQGEDVYWDLGKGERPQKTVAEFLHVAKREAVPVKITRQQTSLKLHFPEKQPSQTRIRVKSSDGLVKAEMGS